MRSVSAGIRAVTSYRVQRRGPETGLVQGGAGRARRFGDLAGGHGGGVVQHDGAPLPGGQAGHRAAQRVGAIQVLGRGQAAG